MSEFGHAMIDRLEIFFEAYLGIILTDLSQFQELLLFRYERKIFTLILIGGGGAR